MTNMLDYLRWRGDIPLSASPFNEIDNIIFSMLSFIDFSSAVTPDADGKPVSLAECLEAHTAEYSDGQMFGAVIPKDNNDLLALAAKSARFGNTYVLAYRDEIDEPAVKQFAAVTFILPDNSIFTAFRGTDDTFVGWKEDLAMSYAYPTASQRESAEYLTEIAACHRGKIRIGGHSKGGNLSVYAAAFCPEEVRERIVAVYNNDGPGFLDDVYETEEYKSIKDRLVTFVPQASLVGMMFRTTDNIRVIESTAKGGAAQHNPYSWVVVGKEFNHLPDLSDEAKRNHAIFETWIAGSGNEDREKFNETIFSVFDAAGTKTLTEFGGNKMHNIAAIMKAIAGFDRETRDNAMMFIKRLVEAIWKE